MKAFFRNHKWLLMLMLGGLALDQVSKAWVRESIYPGTYILPQPIEVIEGFLYWVHIHNYGAAWGSFSEYTWLLAVLGIIVVSAVFALRKMLGLARTRNQVAFGLMLGGILGNLFDRIYFGYVIDFIDVHLPGYRWPAFNIADILIFAGVGLYILFTIKE